jgi:hypothetical protein
MVCFERIQRTDTIVSSRRDGAFFYHQIDLFVALVVQLGLGGLTGTNPKSTTESRCAAPVEPVNMDRICPQKLLGCGRI